MWTSFFVVYAVIFFKMGGISLDWSDYNSHQAALNTSLAKCHGQANYLDLDMSQSGG